MIVCRLNPACGRQDDFFFCMVGGGFQTLEAADVYITSQSSDIAFETRANYKEFVNNDNGIQDTASLEGISKFDFVPAFNPSLVTTLNISDIQDALDNIFLMGSLPNWLRNFTNLQILIAAKCGLVLLDPWILELNTLREIYLEHNFISTWPHFLHYLPALEYICLDGNPCLEKAFCKSPSLRSQFFNWGPSKDSYKSISRYIRGPEWQVAAAARMGIGMNIDNFGHYFGGIYTLSNPPHTSNDGLLTPLEPCPLQTRLLRSKSPPKPPPDSFRITFTSDKYLHKPPGQRKTKQSEILINIFKDITELLHRKNDYFAQRFAKTRYVPITGHAVDIGITNNSSSHNSEKKDIDIYCVIWSLLKEEEQYCAKLRRVIKDFFSCSIQSHAVAGSLSTIFRWFPNLCSLHHKAILPALTLLANASNGKSKHYMVKEADSLCKALLKAKSSYEWYARRLDVSESYLDLTSNYSGLYRTPELQEYVRKQVMKLGGMNAYLSVQFSNGTSVSNKDYINRSRNYDMLKGKKEKGPVIEWATKELNKSNTKIKGHPSEYLFLPLSHIVRYERVFTMLSYMDSCFDTLKTTCRDIRRHVAYRRRTALIEGRLKLLNTKFRTSSDAFKDYKWDAVVSVTSRSYLEKGILDPKTVDVFDDVLKEPASFVTETFNENNQRLLRLICCGFGIQLWDEIFEHLIGTIERKEMCVKALENTDQIQIIFLTVREVCRVSIKEFSAPYVALKSDTEEFIEANEYDKYMF